LRSNFRNFQKIFWCGHKQKNAALNEYGLPASDLLSGTATKANSEEKGEE
jgi:hypothetical protein